LCNRIHFTWIDLPRALKHTGGIERSIQPAVGYAQEEVHPVIVGKDTHRRLKNLRDLFEIVLAEEDRRQVDPRVRVPAGKHRHATEIPDGG